MNDGTTRMPNGLVEKLVSAASRIHTWQTLIALGLLIFFTLFYLILDLGIVVELDGNQSFEVVLTMVKGIIWITLAIVALGVLAFIVTKIWGKPVPVGPPREVMEVIARWLPSDFGLKAARGRWEKTREPGEPWPGTYVRDQDAEDASYSAVQMVLGKKSPHHKSALNRVAAFRNAENLSDWTTQRDKLLEDINAIFS